MRKITMTLAAALFVLGSMAVASAQTQAPGAASLHGQAQNATIIHKAACGGHGVATARPEGTGFAVPIAAGAPPADKRPTNNKSEASFGRPR